MNYYLKIIISIFILFSATVRSEAYQSKQPTLDIPPGFMILKNNFSSLYKNTTCFDLKKRSLVYGLICYSSNEQFFNDMGIRKVDEVTEHGRIFEKSESNYIAITPAFQYELKPFQSINNVYAAKIDCNLNKTNTYRADSDCHIAIKLENNTPTVLTLIFLKNNTTHKNFYSYPKIGLLWESIIKQQN